MAKEYTGDVIQEPKPYFGEIVPLDANSYDASEYDPDIPKPRTNLSPSKGTGRPQSSMVGDSSNWEEWKRSAKDLPRQIGEDIKSLAENSGEFLKTVARHPIDSAIGGAEVAASLLSGGVSGAVAPAVGAMSPGDTEQNAADFAQRNTYSPRTETGKRWAENVGEAIDASGVAGMSPLVEFSGMGKAVRPALGEAKEALAPEAAMIKQGAAKVKEALPDVVPKVAPETAELAAKAKAMGIEIPPHMLSDNKFVRMSGEFMNNIPIGSPKKKNIQAFNQYLTSLIGGDEKAETLTPVVFHKAMDKSGNKIGEIFGKTSVSMSGEFGNDLEKIKHELKGHPDETERMVGHRISELRAIAKENGGVIPGNQLRRQNTLINEAIRGAEKSATKSKLSDLQESIIDAVNANLKDDADKAALFDARKKYAIGKTIEPLVAKGNINGISPQALLGRVTANKEGKHRMAMGTAGELGDAAAIAQNFMKETPSSGTAERGFVMNALSEAAGVAKAVAAAVPAYAYNKLGGKLSDAIIEKSSPKPVTGMPATGREPLALADEPAFAKRPEPPTLEPKTRGLLSLQDEPPATTPDTKLLAKRHDIPERTTDFPLRQEVLQRPEIVKATDAFRAEAERLQNIISKAIDRRAKANAQQDLDALQKEFAAGMKQLGIETAPDAHGLLRPLYEYGTGKTQLPIEKTFTTDRLQRKRQASGVTP